MKKVFAFLLTVVMVVTATAMVVSARPSPERKGIIAASATAIDIDGSSYSIDVVEPVNATPATFESAVKDLIKKTKNKNLKIVDIAEAVLSGAGNPTFPATLSFKVSGISSSNNNYILFKKADGTIVTIKPTLKGDTMTAEFPELGEFVLVSDKKVETSHKTGTQTASVAALLLISALAVAYSAKKIFA